MTITAISVDHLKALGPYSIATRSGGVVYCSGQIHLDPATGALREGSIADQTRQCLDNLSDVLKASGLGFGDVVKTTVFLADMGDFKEMNAVYETYVSSPYPARSTVQVAALPLGARVEIEATAVVPAT